MQSWHWNIRKRKCCEIEKRKRKLELSCTTESLEISQLLFGNGCCRELYRNISHSPPAAYVD